MSSEVIFYKKKHLQYLISFLAIALSAGFCSFFSEMLGYKTIALVLLLVVSVLAMQFDMLPILFTAMLSALVWNFFFIPPRFTFQISSSEDALLFLMYFVIAIINAVLTTKIRQFEKAASQKEEKEKTIRLYNTLLNSLSHELRTPISTVIGAVDTLKDNGVQLTEVQRMELLQEIAKAVFRLNRQVENLLNMSRLESGMLPLRLDWCDVNELVHKLIAQSKEEAIQHPIFFEEKEGLPLFKIDSVLIEQAMQNILYNAIQYTPAGSPIYIDVWQEYNICFIKISDSGPGFPEKELDNVFDKFYRLHQSKTGGLGLGLSIAKGFVEAHSGLIQLNNAENGGAEFVLKIPAETLSLNDLKHE